MPGFEDRLDTTDVFRGRELFPTLEWERKFFDSENTNGKDSNET